MTAPGAKTSPAQLRAVRRTRPVGCPEHLIVAPLWVSYEANLGTLLRTCDAVGACMAVPSTSTYTSALMRGDTLSRRPHIHWMSGSKLRWVAVERAKGARILAVELADDAEHAGVLARGGSEGSAARTMGVVARFSMVRDPDGNWLELSQRASLTGPLP